MAKRKSDDILRYVASEMFKKAGMRLFMLSAWKNEEGKLLVSSHDYNDEFGNGESFSKTCDWQVILPEWESYVSKQFRKWREMMDCPVLPDHTEMDSDTRKAIMWAYLNWHYQECSGKPKDPVPWKEVILRQEELIPPPYLPTGRKLREPSRMNREEATELLDFWYNRQENCRDVTFEFYRLVEQIRQGSKTSRPGCRKKLNRKMDGGKGIRGERVEPGTSSRRKSVVRAVDPSESSDDEDRHTARTAKPANVVDSEDSRDEFNLSDESSDDHLSSPKMGKEPIKHKARRNGKKDPPPKTRNVPEVTSNEDHVGESRPVKKTQPSAEPVATSIAPVAVNMAKGTETREEPSASRAPPTPLDKPRRVGPASRVSGALRRRPGDHSRKAVDNPAPEQTLGERSQGKKRGPEVGLQCSPNKRPWVEPNEKKRPAEDPLEGSPAKHTRSKTTDVLPKRSKKPNSTYAANFVRS
ncbi:hypothetical protein DFH29DRAFT_1000625 [Suillus ampliporus]|nr:hypothetical protein DFH29DRAFT_1000625 [Suillus ampliporus]